MSKTVLITGASKGIGAATAILFAQKGGDCLLYLIWPILPMSLLANLAD